MGSHQHHHVREAVDHNAEVGFWSVLPPVLQLFCASAADVDPVEATCDGVKTCCIDDDVEGKLGIAGVDAGGSDTLDRRFQDIHQFHVVLVVDFVVLGLQRYTPCPKSVVLRD
jgi:hypothetical protein